MASDDKENRTVMEKTPETPTGWVSSEFGYYPLVVHIETDQFSVQTLGDHKKSVAGVADDPNVHDEWIYPGAQQQRDFMSGSIRSMPYSARVFGLPKTHVLALHEDGNQGQVEFVIWCLSFFTGMRLTATEAGFLDATPIEPGKLVDFALGQRAVADAIQVSLDYMDSERNDPRAIKRVGAAIHALFLGQSPHNLPFERFQYLYMALDACSSLVVAKEAPKRKGSHAKRIRWMCERFSMSVPSWADTLSIIRNDAFHEALFFERPLGFAIHGGDDPEATEVNIELEMQALVCRLLVAILGMPEAAYVRTPVNTRMRHSLNLARARSNFD
ncbi:hypothetical protein [Lysobacter sp. A378]